MIKMSMYSYLTRHREMFHDRTSLIFFGKRIKFGTIVDQIDRMAQGLYDMGIRENDTVTICLPNCPNTVVAFYAVNRLGAIANMVHPLTPTAQLMEFMKRTNSNIVFLNDFAYFRYKDDLIKNSHKTVICRFQNYLSKGFGAVFSFINRKKTRQIDYKSGLIFRYSDLIKSPVCTLPPDNSYDKPSVYLHSGGTTGVPKTIMLSNNNFNYLGECAFDIIEINSFEESAKKVMLAVLPQFHGFGLCVCTHMILSCGASSYLLPKFTAKSTVKALKRGKVNIFTGVPTMYGRLIANKKFDGKYLSKVDNVFSGADTFPKGIRDKLTEILKRNNCPSKVCEGYGLTETVTVCCVNTNGTYKEGSMGKALRGMEMRAWDEEKNDFCPAGQAGELVVRGPSVMLGYLGDPETTAQVLREHDGEIWVHSGDYGMVDEEGFAYFRQRIKRIVKISGVAIFPSEIEEAVTNLPYIKHACAVGVPREKSGTAIRLYIELKEGMEPSEEIRKQILEECARRVIKWAVPREIIFEKNLPLTLVGKVDIKKLEGR